MIENQSGPPDDWSPDSDETDWAEDVRAELAQSGPPAAEALTAADYVLAAIGPDNAGLLVAALTAGWLTPEEAERLRPLAAGIAYLGGVDLTAQSGPPTGGN